MKKKSGDSGDLLSGNTKERANQLTKLFFTWNNYDKSLFNLLEITFLKFCQKAMIQSEVGLECKTPHLHGAIWFKINPLTNKPFKHRWNELKLPETIHWEKFIGSDEDVITYCSKEGEDGFDGVYRWSFGMPKPLKCITTLYPYQKECLDYCMSEPDGQTVWWVYEGIGGEGKSSFCRYMIINHNSIVIQGGKLADIMNIIFNTDMSIVETIIFIHSIKCT